MKKVTYLKKKSKFLFNTKGKVLFILALLSAFSSIYGQTQINDKYCFNNNVLAIAKAPDGSTYVGGSFTNVAEYTGNAIKFDPGDTPGFNINDVKVQGTVLAIVPIPEGGWYIGGSFSRINGIPRPRLARINADGSLHEFNPTVNILSVASLVFDSSGKLYVGGLISFGIGGIICFNPDGTLTDFNPTFNNSVNVLAIDANDDLFAAGPFTSPRNRLAKFDADGTLNAFSPIFNSGTVSVITFNSVGEFLVGGSFTSVNGNARNRLVKFNADTSLNAFSPVFNGTVSAITFDTSDNFYVGGEFTTIDGTGRNYLAKFNANGTLDTFNPHLSASVLALRLDNSGNLCCGGNFTLVGGMFPRNYFAKFDAAGNLHSFNPSMNASVAIIAVNALGIIYIGGGCSGMKAETRNRLATFNADGTLNNVFKPSFSAALINASVYSLAVDGLGNLYVGGDFKFPKNRLAKFNVDHTLNSFSYTIYDDTAAIYALVTDSANNLYVGGFGVGGTLRCLLKFDSNGTIANFNPSTTTYGRVYALAIDAQDNLHVGGGLNIDGGPFIGYAKFSTNGTPAASYPYFDNTVYSLSLDSSGNIYAGGAFAWVNNEPRANLAKINADGTLNPYSHAINGNVRAILPTTTGTLFICGEFTNVDGIIRSGFAKFNVDGSVSSFYKTRTYSFLMDGSTLYLGGGFQRYEVYTNGDSTCDLTLSNPVAGSRCGTGSVTLSITPSSGTVNWYDAPTNGNLVGTGAAFTTPIISSTKAYYAQAVDGDCVSFSRTEVVATVLPSQTCASTVNLKLFIQGYYTSGGLMTTVQNNQDFPDYLLPPNTNVENITVELHDAVSTALVASTTAMLQTNGTAVCTFATAPSGSFYIAVKTRNTVQTWSKVPQTVGATPLNYDFSSSASQAYNDNQAALGDGVFGLLSGDIDSNGAQDGEVNPTDYSEWEAGANALLFGSHAFDLNGDGEINPTDYTIWETNANALVLANYPTAP